MSVERTLDKVFKATNEKLSCPTCGDELYKIKSKYVCANEGCDYQSLSNQFKSSVIPWNLNSSAEENYWKEAVFEKYPYIIATEYRRLYDLLIENKLYGMIFQIKDVFEIILKLPTLLCLNRMIINKSRSKDENEIIGFFVSKMLSLGDWHSIARKCMLLTDDDALRRILQDIVKIYDKHHIIKWRNDTIGHGALMFDNTEEFREDLIHKLTLLKKHFDNCNQQYVDFELSYKTKKDTVELKGANVKRHLLSSKGIIVWGKTEVQDLILVNNKELYFFDSYLSRESKTKLLNYIDAKIVKMKLKNVEVIYRNIPKELLAESDSSSIVDDGIYAESEVDMLNYISKCEKLITPEYLKTWLTNQLENNKKGIFLIQMEEGMGKTTFSRLLDPHVSGKIKLQNISVRSYYVNSTYSYKLDMFQNDVIDLLKSNNDKSDRLKGNLPIFNSNSKLSTRKQFANILNEYQSVYSRKFGSEKLLFIIDGLDEIPELSSDSIFDYIPNYEDLSENIYILLTSRVHDENLSLLNSKISKINLTNRVEYNRNYESYNQVLHQFIRKQMKISNEELIIEIIKHSYSRFSYIKPIEKIMKYRENDNIQEINVFEEFIHLLKENYSSKYFNQLIHMISMLAVSRDGLSITEISFLLNSKRADFKLLAYIADINSLLTTKRTYRGTVIALSHYSLKKYIIENYHAEIRTILEMMLYEFRAININSTSTGEKYIVFNILYLTKEYAPEKLDMLINEKNMDITQIYEVFASSQAANSDMKSLLLFMDDYIEILETNPKRNSMKLIIVYILRMQAYVKYGFGSVSESSNFIDRALDIMEKYKIKNDLLKIEALKVRCEYYRKIGNIKKSLDDNNSLGEILANLNTKNMKGLVLSSHETASMLINKSINMKNLNQLKDSIKYSLQAKELVSNDDSYDGRTLYSNALNTLGLCYIKDKKYDKAEKNIRESIDICEKLIKEYQIDDNLVFNLYANLCQVYRWNKKFDAAIDLYTDSINRIISKESEDSIIDLNLKALQYNGRGNIYFEMGQIDNSDINFQLSIKDYLKGIDVIESLHSSNQDIRLLEQLYINAYNIFENWIVDKVKSREYETKVNDISRRLMRIQLDNHVDDDKTIDDIKYFVQANKIFESAQKYVEKNQLKKAEKKYCDCIMLLEKIDVIEENNEPINMMLYESYYNRATINNNLLNEKVMYYFNRMKMGENILCDYSMFKPDNIIRDYLIASSFDITSDLDKAKMYEKISGIYCEVLKDFHEAKRYALKAHKVSDSRSDPYVHLGNAYYELDDFESAINCYNQAISIDPHNIQLQENLVAAKIKFAKSNNLSIRIE